MGRVVVSSIVAIGFVGSIAAAYAQPTLRLFNWVDYMDPTVIEDFEVETGIDVVVETYTTSEQVEARLLLGGRGIDLAVVYSQQVDRLVTAGVIEPFDLSLIPNSAGLDTSIMALMPGAAGDLRSTMPYFWGTTGVGYNKTALAQRFPDGVPKSWDLIFDPETASRVQDCGIRVIDAPETVIGAALAWLGRDPRSKRKGDVEAAMAAIETASVQWSAIDSELINAMATGTSCVTLAWSTEVLLAQAAAADGVKVGYFLPDEGSEIWLDSFAIPKGAQNRVEAHRFVDFLLRPDIAARLTNWSHAANAVPASSPMVDPAIRDDASVYPSQADRAGFFPLAAIGTEMQADINNRWMWIKLPK